MKAPEPQFDDLYREVILDHYRRPRNRGRLAEATATAEGANPVCGDEVMIGVRLDDGRVADIAFDGLGCSISQASASLLTDRVRGGTLADAANLGAAYRGMLVNGEPPAVILGDLEALEGVHRFPVRVKCALLALNVLEQALQGAARQNGRETNHA